MGSVSSQATFKPNTKPRTHKQSIGPADGNGARSPPKREHDYKWQALHAEKVQTKREDPPAVVVLVLLKRKEGSPSKFSKRTNKEPTRQDSDSKFQANERRSTDDDLPISPPKKSRIRTWNREGES